MNALLRSGIVTLAATVGAGTVVVGIGSVASADEDAYAKREDTSQEWVVSSDDDDSDDDTGTNTGNTDTNTGTGPGTDTGTGATATNDSTGSRVSAVSRDRDHSRGDQTRDWTRDGGDRTRDFSGNMTNDGSRNDTR